MRREKHGVTLVEAMVAVLILGLALIGTTAAFSHGIAIIRGARKVSIATNACREEMETVRNTAFSSLSTGSSSFTVAGISGANGERTVVGDYGGYDDIKKVTVTVTWDEGGREDISKTLVTLVTRFGINPD